MAEPKIMRIEGAAKLAQAGMFARGEMIGVTEHGAAIYAFDKTVIVRPLGPRPKGVRPYPAAGRFIQ